MLSGEHKATTGSRPPKQGGSWLDTSSWLVLLAQGVPTTPEGEYSGCPCCTDGHRGLLTERLVCPLRRGHTHIPAQCAGACRHPLFPIPQPQGGQGFWAGPADHWPPGPTHHPAYAPSLPSTGCSRNMSECCVPLSTSFLTLCRRKRESCKNWPGATHNAPHGPLRLVVSLLAGRPGGAGEGSGGFLWSSFKESMNHDQINSDLTEQTE